MSIRPDRIDVELMWELFREFVAGDTGARIGENRIAPDDPRLASFAHDVAAPALSELGADVTVDALNNVLARFGDDSGSELLLVAYPAVHHGNEMESPLVARRTASDDEECWIGLGASQSKGALAAACAAIRLLRSEGLELAGRISVAVCSEGSSSHASSAELLRSFDRPPRGAVVMVGTESRISLGNRGRVDVVVEVAGQATHSSSPWLGRNPIPVVAEVLARIAALPLDGTLHEQLGGRAITPYRLVCGPIAPHTIPDHCTLVLDRRTLPGEDEADVVSKIGRALADLPVAVTPGPFMLPALVSESDAVVSLLQEGARNALGRPLETFHPPYTFDAGSFCAAGVPAVMCGPSSASFEGPGILGEDFVLLRHLREAATTYAGAIAANEPG